MNKEIRRGEVELGLFATQPPLRSFFESLIATRTR